MARELARELARVDRLLSARQGKTLRKGAAVQEANQAMPQIHRRYCKKNSQGGSCPVVHLVLRIQFCVAMVTTAPCSLKFKEKSMILGSANQACVVVYKTLCQSVGWSDDC